MNLSCLVAYLEIENEVKRLLLLGHITEAQAQQRIENAKSIVKFLINEKQRRHEVMKRVNCGCQVTGINPWSKILKFAFCSVHEQGFATKEEADKHASELAKDFIDEQEAKEKAENER